MTKCKKCNADSPDLRWDKEHHEQTGKWRLFNQSLNIPHECKIKQKEEPKEPKMIICRLCDPQDEKKKMSVEQYQIHKYSHLEFQGYRAD